MGEFTTPIHDLLAPARQAYLVRTMFSLYLNLVFPLTQVPESATQLPASRRVGEFTAPIHDLLAPARRAYLVLTMFSLYLNLVFP